jgi:hypothetical protein
VSASIQITTKGGQTYAVNFATMEQTNVRTDFVRRIKRCEKANAAKDITAFPNNWVAQGDEDANRDYAWWQKCTLVDVPKYQPEWQQVLSALKESLPNAELLKLQRCQIRHLWRSYKNRREVIQLKSGNATTNEKSLWHGTSNTGCSLRTASTTASPPRVFMAPAFTAQKRQTTRTLTHTGLAQSTASLTVGDAAVQVRARRTRQRLRHAD